MAVPGSGASAVGQSVEPFDDRCTTGFNINPQRVVQTA